MTTKIFPGDAGMPPIRAEDTLYGKDLNKAVARCTFEEQIALIADIDPDAMRRVPSAVVRSPIEA